MYDKRMRMEDDIKKTPPGLTILVVDDDKMVRERCREILAELGMEVCVTESVEEALRRIDGRSFVAVLCDYVMPGKCGLHLYDALRALNRPEADRFIIMTGLSPYDIAAKVPILSKPINASDLREAVQKLTAARSPSLPSP